MKIYILLLCFSVCSLKAQKDYRFSVMVSYDMYLNFGSRDVYKAVLLYSDKAAFFSYKITSEPESEEVENGDVTEILFSIQDTTTQITWSDKTIGKVSEIVKIKKTYKQLTEPLDAIVWEMSSETKSIGNYTCHKATCRYRGRNYTAWFAPDIPCTWGPWKLQGLPGAILEAYDDKNEVSFYATGVVNKDTIITVPANRYEVISKKEYLSQLREFAEDFSKRMGSRMKEGFKVSVSAPKIYGIEIPDEK